MVLKFVFYLVGLHLFIAAFWAFRRKVVYPPFFPRLTYSREYFPVRFWLLAVTYTVVGLALVFLAQTL